MPSRSIRIVGWLKRVPGRIEWYDTEGVQRAGFDDHLKGNERLRVCSYSDLYGLSPWSILYASGWRNYTPLPD